MGVHNFSLPYDRDSFEHLKEKIHIIIYIDEKFTENHHIYNSFMSKLYGFDNNNKFDERLYIIL